MALVAPAAGAVITGPTNVILSAQASAIPGVASISYVADGAVIGTTTGAAGSIVWVSPAFGDHVLAAIAMDTAGATATSAPVTIHLVTPPTNTIDLLPAACAGRRKLRSRRQSCNHPHQRIDLVALEILFPREEALRPAGLHERRAQRRHGGQKIPALLEGDQEQPGVQEGDVNKEPEGIVLAAGEQSGREKAAEHAKDRDDHGV